MFYEGKDCDVFLQCAAKHYPNLTELDLNNTWASDTGILAMVQNCPKLATIALGCTYATDKCVQLITQHCPNLSSLRLCYANVSDIGLRYLAAGACHNLSHLGLSHTNISDTGLRYLTAEACPNLTSLNLGGCSKITDDSIHTIMREHGDKLEKLGLCKTSVTDEGIRTLMQQCHQLNVLDLTGTRVTDATIQTIAKYCPNLTQLHLFQCPEVTDEGLTYLVNLEKLQELSLPSRDYDYLEGEATKEYLWFITLPKDLLEFLRGQKISTPSAISTNLVTVSSSNLKLLTPCTKKIKKLRLVHSDEFPITGADVRFIAENFPNVTMLSLNECIHITDQSVKELAQKCSDLTILDLHNTHITAISLKALAEHCTNLSVLGLGKTDIRDFSCLQGLKKLTTLYLNYAHIKDTDLQYLPKSIASLNLAYTTVRNVSALKALPNLQTLRLSKEILLEGKELKRYLNLLPEESSQDEPYKQKATAPTSIQENTSQVTSKSSSNSQEGKEGSSKLPVLLVSSEDQGSDDSNQCIGQLGKVKEKEKETELPISRQDIGSSEINTHEIRGKNCSEPIATDTASKEMLPVELTNFLGQQGISTSSLNTEVVNVSVSDLPMLLSHGEHFKCLKLNGTAKKPILNKTLEELRHFPNLTELYLWNCPDITDVGLKHLPKSLTKLYLAGCVNIADKGFQYLPQSLTTLDLRKCNKVTGTGFQYLPRGLTTLDLRMCEGNVGAGFQYLPKTLTTLYLSGCTHITDTDLRHLSMLPLTQLNLICCNQVTDAGLKYLPKSLAVLHLEHCTKITDAGLGYLQELPLTKLNLRSCSNITDQGLRYLPESLTILYLGSCENVTDSGLEHLPSSIITLDLKGCKRITKSGLIRLAEKLPSLQSLTLPNGKEVDGNTLKEQGAVAFLRKHDIKPENLKKVSAYPSELPALIASDNNIRCLTLYDEDDDPVINYTLSHIQHMGITHLGLTSCNSITGPGLQYLPKTLICLDLAHCTQITDPDLQYLPESITELNLVGCPITSTGLKRVSENLPNLQTLRLPNGKNLKGSALKKYFSLLNKKEDVEPSQGVCLRKNERDLSTAYKGKESTIGMKSPGASTESLQEQSKNSDELPSTTITAHPRDLSTLSQHRNEIESLKLKHTKKDPVEDKTLSHLERFPNLISLDLSECCNLTSASLQYLPKTLIDLHLKRCRMIMHGKTTDAFSFDFFKRKDVAEGVKYLKEFSQLTHLDLSDLWLMDIDIEYLSEFTQLTELNLSGCSFSDKSLSHLSRLTKLELLDLRFCKHITDDGIACLANMPNLKVLYLPYDGKIEGEGLRAYFESLPLMSSEDFVMSLNKENIKSNELRNKVLSVTIRELADLTRYASDIQRLRIHDILGGTLSILKYFPHLVALNLSENKAVTDSSLQYLPEGLRELDLKNRMGISDEGLKALPKRLTKLNVSGCRCITGIGLKDLSKSLVILNLHECDVTSDGLKNISGLKEITTLDLRGCKRITDLSPLQGLPKLTHLYLGTCTKIKNKDLVCLKELPGLQELELPNCKLIRGTVLKQYLDRLSKKERRKVVLVSKKQLDYHLKDTAHCVPKIRINYNLTDEDLQDLVQTNPHITDLHLMDCSSLTTVDPLCKLRELHVLSLIKGNNLKLDDALPKLNTVIDLKLGECETLEDLNSLSKSTNLENVELVGCRNLRNVNGLLDLPKLTTVNLSNCQNAYVVLGSRHGYKTHTNGWGQIEMITNEFTKCSFEKYMKSEIVKKGGLPNIYLAYDVDRRDLEELVKRNPSITGLRIRGFDLYDHDPYLKSIGTFTNLRSLNLGECNRVSGAGIRHLTGLQKLESLTLGRYVKFNDIGLVHINAFRNLISLDLSGRDNITDADLKHVANLGSLRSLNLSGYKRITSLRSLNLSGCKRITDDGIRYLLKLENLATLNLSCCSNITDAYLCYLPKTLTDLSLTGCSDITDAGLKHLRDLPLKKLSLGFCENITGVGLQYLYKMKLTHLDLSRCINVTKADVEKLKSKIPNLSVVW